MKPFHCNQRLDKTGLFISFSGKIFENAVSVPSRVKRFLLGYVTSISSRPCYIGPTINCPENKKKYSSLCVTRTLMDENENWFLRD